jgi:hypothetical protein
MNSADDRRQRTAQAVGPERLTARVDSEKPARVGVARLLAGERLDLSLYGGRNDDVAALGQTRCLIARAEAVGDCRRYQLAAVPQVSRVLLP